MDSGLKTHGFCGSASWIPSKSVDSGFHTMKSGFQALDSGFHNLTFTRFGFPSGTMRQTYGKRQSQMNKLREDHLLLISEKTRLQTFSSGLCMLLLLICTNTTRSSRSLQLVTLSNFIHIFTLKNHNYTISDSTLLSGLEFPNFGHQKCFPFFEFCFNFILKRKIEKEYLRLPN